MTTRVDDGGMVKANGDLAGAPVVLRAYVDDDGGLLAVEYPGEPLSADLAASIMANLIRDTLGPEPDLRDVMAMQRTLVATLNGGESEGTRTK